MMHAIELDDCINNETEMAMNELLDWMAECKVILEDREIKLEEGI